MPDAAHSTPPASPDAPARRRLRGRWIDAWAPEDERFWETTGKRIARRNLILSIFAEHLGFNVWVLWTIVVINLGNIGIGLSLAESFWLTAVPNLIGAGLRVPYTFAIGRLGGRAWTAISAGLLLIPCLLVATIVPSGWLADQSHGTQFWVLLACAATAGFGGGNFSSSMTNISFFYPEGKKGLPLGLNAAGGNIGVAVSQLVLPLVIIIGVPAAAVAQPIHEVHLANAGLVWMPLIVIAVLGALLRMDSLAQARNDAGSYKLALREPQTWIMSILYIGTFGSFIGMAFSLPLVIRNTFPEFLADHPFIAAYLAGLGFTGALVGSLSRPLGGWLSDRIGGAKVTLWCFVAMAAFTLVAIVGVSERSFALFFGSFMVLFAFIGMANGSTYRMIPSIFAALGRREAGEKGLPAEQTAVEFKRRAAAALGIIGAIGAFGGFLVQLVLRQASLGVSAAVSAAETPADKLAVAIAHSDWSIPALWAFIAAYVVLAGMTWFFYLRTSVATQRVPSFAYANV